MTTTAPSPLLSPLAPARPQDADATRVGVIGLAAAAGQVWVLIEYLVGSAELSGGFTAVFVVRLVLAALLALLGGLMFTRKLTAASPLFVVALIAAVAVLLEPALTQTALPDWFGGLFDSSYTFSIVLASILALGAAGWALNYGGKRTTWTLIDIVVVVYALFPVVWMVSLSLKSPESMTDKKFLPLDPTFEHYETIFSKESSLFLRPLLNSIGISLIATLIAVVLGTMAAYAVARLDFPGKTALIGFSLLIAMFPQISLVSPLFEMERALGLFDTWPGLILPFVTFALPLAIYTLSAFFREIPWELEKAAKMDGATPGQAFRRVIAPLAAPGVFTTAILVFIFCWNDFLFAISLTSTEASRTVPAALAFFTGASQFESPTGPLSAAAVIITIPIIVFVLFFQRRIVAGLTSGAVKG
jgi:multiple sugar transport system permease protein